MSELTLNKLWENVITSQSNMGYSGGALDKHVILASDFALYNLCGGKRKIEATRVIPLYWLISDKLMRLYRLSESTCSVNNANAIVGFLNTLSSQLGIKFLEYYVYEDKVPNKIVGIQAVNKKIPYNFKCMLYVSGKMSDVSHMKDGVNTMFGYSLQVYQDAYNYGTSLLTQNFIQCAEERYRLIKRR